MNAIDGAVGTGPLMAPLGNRADPARAVVGEVAIRVDASPQTGAGHIQRCLTLANALRGRGVHTRFVCRQLPERFADSIRAAGHKLFRIGTSDGHHGHELDPAPSKSLHLSLVDDAAQTAEALADSRVDWLVVDHYALDARWETKLRSRADRIFAIDDLADRPHDCDLLLDQNLYRDAQSRYAELAPRQCRQLLGPRYALLRPEFARLRSTLRERDGRVTRVLVAFGGADASNYTGIALEALDALGRSDVAIDVVVGIMNTRRAEIERACAARPNTRFFCQVEDVARLMAEADLGVGAGGITTWERCCLGLPTLAVVTADNQRQQIADLSDRMAVLCPSSAAGDRLRRELIALLDATLSSRPLLRGMSRLCTELVDGAGTQRVVGAMLSVATSMRLATPADCEWIYLWRNHPDVRRGALDTNAIDYETHRTWYAAALSDANRVLLVAECAGQAVGVVRFDISGTSANVSLYLLPDILTGGWGAGVLERAADWLRSHMPQVQEIVAQVRPDNLASRGAFRRAGYQERASIFIRRVES